ncbi:MAG: hypothetical protein HRU51_09165 [Xanthomonadales bacterium]|nr:hypothetical protein [Xanthomonadales bacterium]
MKPAITLFLLTLLPLLPFNGFANHPRDQWLSTDQIIADTQLAQETYERIHPGYDRYTDAQTLNTAWDQIIQQAKTNKGMRLGDYYLKLSETLALMRCDHTKAELPKALADARGTTPVYLPFRWQMIENEVVVLRATADSGLKLGDVITHIDGQAIGDRIDQLYRYVPTDGFTDHSKINAIASSSEHRGGALDHFGAMLWPHSSQVNIHYLDQQGQSQEKSMARINYSAWKKLGGSQRRNFIDAVEFKQVDDRTGYLKIDTFVNYRIPIKPDKLFDPIFKQLQQNPSQRLILDLRENGGGSSEPRQRLLAHLMPNKFRPVKDVRIKTLNLDGLREHLFTWEKSALKPKASKFNQNDDGSYSFKPHVLKATKWIKPDKRAFTGQLIVLTSRNNSSGSTNLLAVLTGRPNTTFVGEPTGGSMEGPTAGILFFLKLPASGITTRVPIFRQYNDVAQFEPGMGLSPDVAASQNKQDLLNGIDTILQAAIDLSE